MLRILLLEDNPADAELVERTLLKADLEFESRRVEQRESFLDVLDQGHPDVILADLKLPHFDGMQALRLVRERDADLPFIFVTGAVGEEGAVEFLFNGASDYILKGNLNRLPSAIDRALETARQRQALKSAEQALRESVERFRALVETTMDWIWEIDVQGRYTYASPASISLLGYRPEEVLGRHFLDLMPPEALLEVGDHFRAIIAAQEPFALLENSCLRKDGRVVVLETSGTPIFSEQGGFQGYRGIARDITERRRHEATLLLQARRATALLDLPKAAERMDESAFMQFGQELAEQLTDSQIAFIHLVHDDQQSIELVTWSRRTLEGYCRLVHETHYAVDEAGIWADALRTRAPVVINDYAAEPDKRGLPDGHADLLRLISVPVMDGDLVRMLAGVGNKATSYTDLDVETVQLIANEIWRIVCQRRTQSQLRQREAHLHTLVDTIPDLIWLKDPQGQYLACNPMFERFFGASETAVRGRTDYDFVDRALADFFRAKDVAAIAAGGPLVNEEWVTFADDGHQALLETIKTPMWDKAGSLIGVLGIARDITARKHAEDELRKLSLAVEQSPASIVITDLEGCIEYANPSFSRVSGYSLEEARGRNPRILKSGRTPPEVYSDLWTTLSRGEIWRGEFHNKRKDGSEYVELAIVSPVRQPNGTVTHYLAVKEDITEKKRVEDELEHYRAHLEELVETRTAELTLAEERSRLILESSADGLYGEDLEGCVTFVNPAACAMLGYAAEQLLGRNMHDLIHHSRPDGRPYPRCECPVHGTSHDGYLVDHQEHVFWRADGHPLPVSYSSHPMYRKGRIVGAVVSFIDISVRKQAEKAREEALSEAERLARLKSEFLANMSHEIRTPLNAVLGFAQIGVRESDGRKARDFFSRILDSGQLLLGIVNDILDFSKIEAGKLTIDQSVIDLREVIERSVNLLRIRAREKGLDFRFEESSQLPASCRGDGLRLAQILGNLLSNAIKFTEEGQVTLTASRAGDRLLFSVSDTGIGMTDAQVAHLFRPFEQADGSITRRFGGTGLGLAITKRLVDMMGGEISVQSRIGQGTRFEVGIPVLEPRGRISDHLAKDDRRLPAAKTARLRGLMILVAEDNEANRLVLEELLNAEGCWLVQVGNGLQAVERVREDGIAAFDLVLMDIQMPVMDGFEATRKIRELAPGLPIIGLTAHALQPERAQCLAAGMVDHIAKPFELDTLVATILEYVTIKPDGGSFQARSPAQSAIGASAGKAADVSVKAALVDAPIDWPWLMARYARHPGFVPKLFASVLESNRENAALLRRAADAGDLQQIASIAHLLKGTAGNLFARRLGELADSTERKARGQAADVADTAWMLADCLDSLLREIRGHAAWQETETSAEQPRISEPLHELPLASVMEQLESLLRLDDTSVNGVYERHQSRLLRALGEQGRQLGLEIKAFDYQSALDTLMAARSDHLPDPVGDRE